MLERTAIHWLLRVFQSPPADQIATLTPFTAAEVMHALRQSGSDVRTRRIHACLANLGQLVDNMPIRRRFRGLEDYHLRLLRIMTMYCRGWEVEAIARDLSLFSTSIGVERAIEVTAEVMADHLNRQAA